MGTGLFLERLLGSGISCHFLKCNIDEINLKCETVLKNQPPPTSLSSPPLPFFAPLFLALTHPPIQQRVVGISIKHHTPPTTRA